MNRFFKSLPAHKGVSIFFNFYQIDDYALDQSVYFKLNGQRFNYTPSIERKNLCGN
jgi:hypothetical protein